MKVQTESINLTAINFNAYDRTKAWLDDLEAQLLLIRLNFHMHYTEIFAWGKNWLVRTRDELADLFGWTRKKIDRLLNLLIEKGLIIKKIAKWKGKKHLYIHVDKKIGELPLNFQLLENQAILLGSFESAVLFSKISFAFNNTKIEHEGKLWCTLSLKSLSELIGVSIGKTRKLIDGLVEKGVIEKRRFRFRCNGGDVQLHFHIPQSVIEEMTATLDAMAETWDMSVSYAQKHLEFLKFHEKSEAKKPVLSDDPIVEKTVDTPPEKEAKNRVKSAKSERSALISNGYSPFCVSESTKMGLSIVIKNKRKEINKTKRRKSQKLRNRHIGESPNHPFESDIDFNKIKTSGLSYRQRRYIEGAIKKFVEANPTKITCPPEVLEEIKFAVLSPFQRKGVDTFKHAVFRCMKILGDGMWRTPKGFSKYCEAGKAIAQKQIARAEKWEREKEAERQFAVSSEFAQMLSGELSPPSVITKQAVYLAKKMVGLVNHAKQKGQTDNALTTELQALQRQLQGFILKGADKKVVQKTLSMAC